MQASRRESIRPENGFEEAIVNNPWPTIKPPRDEMPRLTEAEWKKFGDRK